jgi:hypothetical protein
MTLRRGSNNARYGTGSGSAGAADAETACMLPHAAWGGWCGAFVEGGHTASVAVDWKNAACEHSLPHRVRYVGGHAS